MVVQTELRYPNKSHRKSVRIPRDSVPLAEFFGAMIGDGGINNPWQANITLNTDADVAYIHYIQKLIDRLFGVKSRVMARRNKRATVVSLASTTVVDFLVGKGLPRGNKLAQGLQIPPWILRRKAYKIACVRGLVDTDGCLVLHKHKVGKKMYRNIYLSFSSHSLQLLGQVAEILVLLGMFPSFAHNKTEVYLYSAKCVERYMRVIGTSNDRISRPYKKWRDG